MQSKDEAIRLNPEDANVYYNRGTSYERSREYEKALANYQQTAYLYQKQGNAEGYQRAINSIKKLEQRDGN